MSKLPISHPRYGKPPVSATGSRPPVDLGGSGAHGARGSAERHSAGLQRPESTSAHCPSTTQARPAGPSEQPPASRPPA